MKNKLKIQIPFESIRINEAIEATSDSFKLICLKRISHPKYKIAIRKFLEAFNIIKSDIKH